MYAKIFQIILVGPVHPKDLRLALAKKEASSSVIALRYKKASSKYKQCLGYHVAEKRAKKTISFRLDPQIIDKLSKAAKEDKITLNALVDQVFDNYVHWERRSVSAGWILVKNDVMKLFIESLNERTLRRLAARSAKIVLKDTLLSISGRIDLESWLLVTKYRSVRSNFVYQELRNVGVVKIVITHGMGPKWSLFHKIYYAQMLKDLGRKASVDSTANSLVIEIKTS